MRNKRIRCTEVKDGRRSREIAIGGVEGSYVSDRLRGQSLVLLSIGLDNRWDREIVLEPDAALQLAATIIAHIAESRALDAAA